MTYYLLIIPCTPADVKRMQKLMDSGDLDPEELVRQGRAIRG
jgi:hypothetical protein